MRGTEKDQGEKEASFIECKRFTLNILQKRNKFLSYTSVDLKSKIAEMYPEIEKHGISISLAFSKENNAYIAILTKNSYLLMAPIEKKEADALINGIKCGHLDNLLRQFIKDVEIREKISE